MSSVAPPPYLEGPVANIQGPPQYPGDQPKMSPPYGGVGPTNIEQPQKQQEQQQQVIVHRRGGGTNDLTCCVLCLLTGGLTLPFWICCCLLEQK